MKLRDLKFGDVFRFRNDQSWRVVVFDGHDIKDVAFPDGRTDSYYAQDTEVILRGQGSKTDRLRELVAEDIRLKRFYRLVDGDLSHIGDAILEGKRIAVNYSDYTDNYASFIFSDSPAIYKIEPDLIVVGDVSWPKPETEALSHGTTYYVPDTWTDVLFVSYTWSNADHDRRHLKRNRVHLIEEAAVEHAKAIIKLGGGEI